MEVYLLELFHTAIRIKKGGRERYITSPLPIAPDLDSGTSLTALGELFAAKGEPYEMWYICADPVYRRRYQVRVPDNGVQDWSLGHKPLNRLPVSNFVNTVSCRIHYKTLRVQSVMASCTWDSYKGRSCVTLCTIRRAKKRLRHELKPTPQPRCNRLRPRAVRSSKAAIV